jgi:uncharacterized membrane protein YbhN (UPF0104 family)
MMSVIARPMEPARALLTGRRLLIGGGVAVAVLAVLAAFRDMPAVGRALENFDWRLLPLALFTATLMYLCRFARWHVYARRVAVTPLSKRDSLAIYTAGLGTQLTPGRVGEVVRCAFLRRAADTPVASSAPIIMAERVTDGIGLMGVAVPGVLMLGLGGRFALPLLALPLLAIPLIVSRRLQFGFLRAAARMPVARRYVGAMRCAGDELRDMLAPRLLAPAVLLSLASVALEVVTFGLVLQGLGVDLTSGSYLREAFILPAAMLASAVIVVPGKLGVAESGLAELTRATLAAPAGVAAAGAVLVRLCTLWLGLAVGALALTIATRRWGRAAD